MIIVCLVVFAFAVQQSIAAVAEVRAGGTPGTVVAEGAATGEGKSASDGTSEADGFIADDDSVSVFDDHLPAIANLDPALYEALRRAAEDAALEGIEFRVNSGWRSPEYQARLLQDAIASYGSEQEAARWVATPVTSEHVSGEAVDLGSYDALDWLAQFGSDYGLCQTYQNESWHYELRPNAVTDGCPEMLSDPSHDAEAGR